MTNNNYNNNNNNNDTNMDVNFDSITFQKGSDLNQNLKSVNQTTSQLD